MALSASERPITVEGIDHVVLRIHDLQRALSFYCGVLGCREERRVSEIGLVQLRAGFSMIDLLVVGTPPDGQAGQERWNGADRNMDHVALRVRDFDSGRLRAYLDQNGVPAGPVERRYGAEGLGPSIYITDPEGNIVELKGPPDPA